MRNFTSTLMSNPRRLVIAVCVFAFALGFFSAFAAFAGEAHVKVNVSQGKLVRLSKPAANIFVADPDIADVQVPSASSVYVIGRKAGITTVYALDDDGEPIVATTVTVSYDFGAIKSLIKSEVPDGQISLRSIPGGLVVDGSVAAPNDVRHAMAIVESFVGTGKVINKLSVSMPTQVNLRVRVAEMSRDVAKQLGFNWDALFTDGTFNFGFVTGQPGTAVNPDLIFGGFNRGHFDVSGIIDALAKEGVVSTLAEPNLTAISGETASFLAGGEFPIPVATDNQGVVIEFKQFGVSLDFTPTVLSAERISLHVRPEVSELSDAFSISNNQVTVPGIEVRRAETTVELASGQSFAIAGLLDNRSDSSLSKVPGIGEVPVLGPLFQSSEFRRNETELMIIVTPYIVEPIKIAAQEVPTPVKGFQPANDIERVLGQRLSQKRKAPGSPGVVGGGGSRLIGDAGFYY